MKEFTDLFVNSEEMDSYFFFTDPHFLGGGNSLTPRQENKVNEYLSIVSQYATRCDPSIIICGGDYLNNDTKKNASYKLNFFKGITDKYFPRKNFFSILGNHDTNYQGTDGEGDGTGTGTLTQDTINNILYRESNTKKSYFTITSSNTKYYCFDSGVDNDSTLTPYRKEQIDWFAQNLQNGNDNNIAVVIHIFSNDTSLNPTGENFAGNITPMANAIMDIIAAYNNKTSITVNNVLYDYSSANGRIYFVQCGHTHYDYIYNGGAVPVICTKNATNYGQGLIQFDMAFIDYTNEKISLIRVNGTNRIVNL